MRGDAPNIRTSKVSCSKKYSVAIFLSFTQQNYSFLVYANSDYYAILSGLREIAKLTISQMPDKKNEIQESFKQEAAYIQSRAKTYDDLKNNLRMMGYHCATPIVVEERTDIGTAVFYSYK